MHMDKYVLKKKKEMQYISYEQHHLARIQNMEWVSIARHLYGRNERKLKICLFMMPLTREIHQTADKSTSGLITSEVFAQIR